MDHVRQYRLLLIALTIVVIFLVTTEVPERWGSVIGTWSELRQKPQQMGDPGLLKERRDALLARHESLTSSVLKKVADYQQTQTGVFEFLTACARESQVKLETVAPSSPKVSGEREEVPVVMQFRDTFHRAGQFLNTIENGPIPIKVTKLEIATKDPVKALLDVKVEATAYVYTQGRGT